MSLEDRLESGLPSAWRPDQDDPDILIGTVTDIDTGVSEYAESGVYPIIVVQTEDGTEKAVHGFHSVLANELIRQRPQVGEKIGIKFLGDVETKPGSKFKSYKGYRVKVEREASTFDWSKINAGPDESLMAPAPTPDPVTVPPGAGDDDIPF